ncbi:MAG: serine--tRNA ligase [Candidatus Micrarchaeaceae archaeon]
MITTKYVRDNLSAIRESLQRRRSDYPIDEVIALDEKIRKAKTEMQKLQEKRNAESLEVSKLKKAGADASKKIEGLGKTKEAINELEKELQKLEERADFLLWNMPNIIDSSVPYGRDDSENVEIRKWGDTSKRIDVGHAEILERLGLVDLERAAKISGSRFYYLKGDLVLLEHSLIRFVMDELYAKGFTPIATPYMLRKKYYRSVTGLGDFEDALYAATDTKEVAGKEEYERMEDEMFLIATSEHPIAAMYAGEVLSEKDLPIKYAGFSTCFRREAGSHGKDSKGIFRVHQFEKVEQFVFCTPEDSWRIYDEMIANQESIYQKLGLPYHVVNICTGDLGVVAAKKIDIEGWFPGQQRYRELTSGSNCTDWQSRRLDIKYDGKNGREYVHTLNATGVAVQRVLAAIAENYLDNDGSIIVPDALIKYMGKDRISLKQQ